FDVAGLDITAQEAVARLWEEGVRMGVAGRTRIRAVTHLDVTQAQVERAVEVAQRLLRKAKTKTPAGG
ncbi:MAG TPA: hypothetical protein VNA86_07095, partial [bacterium]|nr:hypothetical protein [bacterium]